MTSRALPLRFGSQTVLITGASSGLGAEFARQLASRGSSLVLVARREAKLEELSADLRSRYGVAVTTIAADLGKADAASTLRSELEARDVHVTSLINNAGFGTSGPFHEEDPQRVRDEIALNVAALVDLTQAFIGQLRTGDGFLVNVASVAGYQPTPGFAVYGATKAFVRSFTEAIWAESIGTRLRVVALSPGPTSTEFFEVAGEDIGSGLPRMTARSVVASTLRELRKPKPGPSVVPGPLNTALTVASKFAPRKLLLRGMSRALGAADHSS
ncbi:MAG: SDR family NAD(P)-dependent oxidoreductase [Pseudoclavibacter sp.]